MLHWLRKLYHWILHWADTPYGPVALFLLSFAEASFFPVPPDVLLIALALGNRRKSLTFAINCALASLLGAILGYSMGHFAWWGGEGEFSALALFFFNHVPGFTQDIFYQVKAQYEQWNFWIVFTAGFTPIPYKVFTITAGAFDIHFFVFLFASMVSRTARFFLVAALIWKYGEPIRTFIEQYFNLLTILFSALLIGGFLLIKYLL